MKTLLFLVPLFTSILALPAPAPQPSPPNVPTTAAAKTTLASLTVAVQGSQDGYSRDLFPTWNTISGTCNTRETVLKRDGTNVVTDTACASTSGSWYSPYDGATWTLASDLDIDHMVPLSNAWKSGAAAWTTARRQAYANDLTNPQLLAVTDNVNESKGDSGPEDWKPPLSMCFARRGGVWANWEWLASYYCTYAKMWVKVKGVYSLTITSAEKTALTSMLNTC
ncbi:putative secreted protein [Lachnellula suecica]|uniref:Putative secreted protein n=1 Tax=Lachnellula suecica TaxID=602035 RepID=A0A8T9C143_9HELO|nr:putative secreted protein [Lachnellula suecica]